MARLYTCLTLLVLLLGLNTALLPATGFAHTPTELAKSADLEATTLARWGGPEHAHRDTSRWELLALAASKVVGPSVAVPDTVKLIAPAYGATGVLAGYDGNQVPDVLEFSWHALPNADDYNIQVALTPDFNADDLFYDTWVSDTTFYNYDLRLWTATTYYWRVRARNAQGIGPWSMEKVGAGGGIGEEEDGYRTFTTGGPASGTLTAPLDTWITLPGTLQWGNTGWEGLIVDDDKNFSSPVISEGSLFGATSYEVTSQILAPGTVYYWRLYGGPLDVTTFTETGSFGTYGAPLPPELIDPDDQQTGLIPPIHFAWQELAVSTPADSFRYEVATDLAFTQDLVKGFTSLPEADEDLAYEQDYYWRVRGINDAGMGAWSAPQTFATLKRPAPPQLVTPRIDSSDVTIVPTLVWSAVPHADRYIVQLAHSPEAFDLPGHIAYSYGEDPQNLLTDTQHTIPNHKALDHSARYYWRVQAVNDIGEGPWSAIWSFTVVPGAAGPTGLTVAGNPSQVFLPALLGWDEDLNAGGYDVEISTDTNFEDDIADFVGTHSYDTEAGHFSLYGDRTYYWRVRANYPGVAHSEWSDTLYFETLPRAPGHLSPANQTKMAMLPDLLTWEAPTGDEGYGGWHQYQVQVTQFYNFDQPLITVNTETPELPLTTSDVAYGQCYEWRIRVTGGSPVAGSQWSSADQVCFEAYPQPTLIEPEDEDLVFDDDVAFEWNAVADSGSPYWKDPTYYDLEVAEDAAFTQAVRTSTVNMFSSGNPPTVSTTVRDLPERDNYYWRVRARYREDGIGPWSETRTFDSNFQFSQAPVLQSPSHNAVDVSRQPLLVWQYVPNAVNERAYIRQNGQTVWSGFPDSATPDANGHFSVEVDEPLAYNTEYTWFVLAWSPTSNSSSEEWSFTTTIEATLDPPVLRAPVDGSTGQHPAQVQLKWYAAPQASGYHLQVSPTANFGNTGALLVNEPLTAETLTWWLYDLDEAEDYHWRVCTLNTSGVCGAWADAVFHTAGPTTLAAPDLLSPLSGATVGTEVSFSWEAVTGAATYEFELGPPTGFGDPLMTDDGLTETSYDLSLTAGDYTWRVRGVDALGRAGAWSQVPLFTVLEEPPPVEPDPPTLDAPDDGQYMGAVTQVALVWQHPGATSYTVEVADNAAFTDATEYAGVTEQSMDVLVAAQQTYHWRVKACDAVCSGWSVVYSFVTEEEPDPPSTETKRYYYLTDHLGSVRATVDEAGAVVSYSDYYPFGMEMDGRTSTEEVTRDNYSGKELDRESELLYYGARYYDPEVVRWLSVDPLAEKHPDWTPYNFVLGNPLLLIDPDGRQVRSTYGLYGVLSQPGALVPNGPGDSARRLAIGEEIGRTTVEAYADTGGDAFELATGRTVTGREGSRLAAGIALAIPFVGASLIRGGGKLARTLFHGTDGLRGIPESKVINALSDFRSTRYQFGSETLLLDKKGIKHILQRHHPDFWDGSVKAKQSFLDKNMSIDDISNAIKEILKQNRDIIIEKGTNSVYQVRGTLDGVEYVVGLNRGRVGQFFSVE